MLTGLKVAMTPMKVVLQPPTWRSPTAPCDEWKVMLEVVSVGPLKVRILKLAHGFVGQCLWIRGVFASECSIDS